MVPSKIFRLPVFRLTRLLLLGLLGCAVLPSTVSAATAKEKVKVKAKALPRNAPVEMIAVNGKEKLALRLRDDKGRPLRGVQKRFDHFLRCHHTNVAHPMNPRLVRVLYQVGKHYPGKTIEVVSGYRDPSVAKNPRSPHMQGLACDFRVNGVKNTELRTTWSGLRESRRWLLPELVLRPSGHAQGPFGILDRLFGAGRSGHVSENPMADVKSGRADTFKPRSGRGGPRGPTTAGLPPMKGGATTARPVKGNRGLERTPEPARLRHRVRRIAHDRPRHAARPRFGQWQRECAGPGFRRKEVDADRGEPRRRYAVSPRLANGNLC